MFGIKINIERKPKEKKEKKEEAGGVFGEGAENTMVEDSGAQEDNNALLSEIASRNDAGWVWQAIAKWSLRLLIFLTPLFFLPWGVSLVAANKQFLVVVLVSVAFIAWLAKTIASGRLIWARTPLNIAIWILVLAWGISAYFSLNKTKSFGFLNVEPDSLLNMLSYFLAFFLVGATFNNPTLTFSSSKEGGVNNPTPTLPLLRGGRGRGGIQGAINVFLCSLAVLAIFMGLKFLNVNFLSLLFGGQAWDFAKAIDFNTIGTINALGLFLGFGLTLVVGLLVAGSGYWNDRRKDNTLTGVTPNSVTPAGVASEDDFSIDVGENKSKNILAKLGSNNKIKQAGLALLALILGAELLLINFRGVWWSLAIAMLFIVAFAFTREVQEVKEKKKEIIKTQKLVLPIIILAISVILLLVNLPLGNLISFPAEVSPSNSATYEIAKEVWKNQSGAAEIGSGPATFGYDYGQFRSKIINETAFWGIKFNQGSNFILTSLSVVGIIGFVGLILLLAAFVWQALKMFRLKQNDEEQEADGENIQAPLIAAIIFGLTAWFLYPINFTLTLFAFIFLGLLAARQMSEGEVKTRNISLLVSPQRTLIISLILIVLMIGSVSALYLEGQKYVASLYFSAGLNYFNRTSDPDIALEKFVKAINLDGSDSLYWRAASQAFLVKTNNILNSSKWQGAAAAALEDLRSEFQLNMSQSISFAQRATQADANEALNWTNLGYIYENVLSFVTGAEKFMIDSYSKALALEPNNPALQVDLGRGHINFADRLAMQINELSKAQKPDSAQINALIAQRNQELDAAIKDLERGVELKTDYSQAHYLLVQAFSRREDIKKAIVKSIDYFSLNQKDPGAAFQLGFFYYKDNQLDNAKAALEWAVALSQDYSNARYFLGLIYDAQGNKQAAKEQFEKIAALNSDNAEIKTILDNLNAGRGALETVVPPAPAPEHRTQAPVPETGGAQQQPLKP